MRSRRTLTYVAAVALAAAASTGALWSAASVTATSPDVQVALTSGRLDLQSTRDGQAVVGDAANMEPGDERSGVVTLTNAGDVAGALSFHVDGPVQDVPADPGLSHALRLRLERCASADPSCPGAQVVLAGAASDPSLAALTMGAPADLGDLAPGAKATYRVTLRFPADDEGALQGASTSVVLAFTAEAGS